MFEGIKNLFRQEPLSVVPPVKRYYNAARQNRLVSDWITQAKPSNYVLRNDLRLLRQRSHDLIRNDPYAKKYKKLVQTNVIGSGVQLQVKPTGKSYKSDTDLSSKIETLFYEWGKKETCSLSQKLSWVQCQNLLMTHLVRDGEALCKKVLDSSNPFGFSLRFYNPEWLDETYNETLLNGNRIIMSVEVDGIVVLLSLILPS